MITDAIDSVHVLADHFGNPPEYNQSLIPTLLAEWNDAEYSCLREQMLQFAGWAFLHHAMAQKFRKQCETEGRDDLR